MSYETRMNGKIEIRPPIPWKYVRESMFLPENARGNADVPNRKLRQAWMRDIMFEIEQRTVETDDGTLTWKNAVALVPTHVNSNWAGKIAEHLQEVVDAFPEHVFYGRIDGEGEENNDMWRLKVIGRKVTKFVPTLVWDEESE